MAETIGHIEFSTVRLPDGRRLNLRVEGLRPDTKVLHGKFLEHVFDRKRREHTRQVIACAGKSLFVSDDLGDTWKRIPIPNFSPPGESVWSVFTTDEGRHLAIVRDKKPPPGPQGQSDPPTKSILVFDQDWKLVKTIPSPGYIWHGNYSIDQYDGTIMYAEYPLNSPNGAAVRRSRDGGLTWEECFRTPTSAQTEYPPETTIKHFHTCQHDPWKPGRWYVSNGDSADKEVSSLWISEDDGDTWKRSEHVITNLDDFPVESHDILRRAVLRMTPPMIEEDAIYAVTDDTFHFEAPRSVVSPFIGALSLRISKEAPHRVTILDNLGKQALRSRTKIDDDYYVTISESKRQELRLNVIVYNGRGWSRRIGHLPLATFAANAGPSGASSFAVKDGCFFTQGSEIRFGPKCQASSTVLRWQVGLEPAEKPTCPVIVVPKRNKRLLHESVFYTDPGFSGCTLCGGTTFEASDGVAGSTCLSCRSREPQRAFALIYENHLQYEFDLAAGPLLHLAPKEPEHFLFSKMPQVDRMTAEIGVSTSSDRKADVNDLRCIPDYKITSVFAVGVLETAKDGRALLSEIHRLLHHEGRLLVAPFTAHGDDTNLSALLQEFFVVKTFHAFDLPTALLRTWYCGVKMATWRADEPTSLPPGVKQIDVAAVLSQKRGYGFLEVKEIRCDKPSVVAVGEPVTWTCKARGDGPIQYAWYVFRSDNAGDRIHGQWYSSANVFTYISNAPGTYFVQVFVRTKSKKLHFRTENFQVE